MTKIIIQTDLDPKLAIDRVQRVISAGYLSESAGRPHYCWHTVFVDGVHVSVARKRSDNSADSFRVYQGEV